MGPFTKYLRFFERDDSLITFVPLIWASLESFVDSTLRSCIQHTEETYQGRIDLCILLLRQRKRKHLDEDLLPAPSRFTSFASVRFKLLGDNGADADLLNLQDNEMVDLDANEMYPVFQDRREELDFGDGTEIGDITESDDDDREREEEELTEAQAELDALFERTTNGTEHPDDLELLGFLIASLMHSMENDVGAPQDKIDSRVVTRLIDLFYCSARGHELVEDVLPRISEQITMWRHLDMDTPNRPYGYIVDTILRMLTIPACEASVESALSRQRLIGSDPRVKSHSELLRARFWITEAVSHS
jgi:hypothetical protein